MYTTVGRLSSYISQGVYTVSGPFHPFGGAVDIVVVEQPDGSFKSTPWYVKFGKFQGVLKRREKSVVVGVNDVEASFHMYLDHKGEAYFLEDASDDDEKQPFSPPSGPSSGDEGHELALEYHKSVEEGNDSASDVEELVVLNSNESIELQFSGEVEESTSNDSLDGVAKPHEDGARTNFHELLEQAVGVESLGTTTTPATALFANSALMAIERVAEKPVENGVEEVHAENGEVSSPDVLEVDRAEEQTSVTSLSTRNGEYVINSCEVTRAVDRSYVITGNSKEDVQMKAAELQKEVAGLDMKLTSEEGSPDSGALDSASSNGIPKGGEVSVVEVPNSHQDIDMAESLEPEVFHEQEDTTEENGSSPPKVSEEQENTGTDVIGKETLQVNEVEEVGPSSEEDKESSPAKEETASTDAIVTEPSADEAGETEKKDELSDKVSDNEAGEPEKKEEASDKVPSEQETLSADATDTTVAATEAAAATQKSKLSLDNNVERRTWGWWVWRGGSSKPKLDSSTTSKAKAGEGEVMADTGKESIVNSKVDLSSAEVVLMSVDGHVVVAEHDQTPQKDAQLQEAPVQVLDKQMLQVSDTTSLKVGPESAIEISEQKIVATEAALRNSIATGLIRNGYWTSWNTSNKTLIPTSEQLASLNLKPGRNKITFTFTTRVLGKQQEDARIYLWKWNTKVVISDVDGTITKSDVLGQVMPLVGRDWTQTGVARLFSAIKDNGYELMFLSARAISQAYLTRQFLGNLKQDGEALPDGPVVISPDGLFPSLYREVIRRAPHEFKIGCLEDIRALFPSECQPFYAGFGNRDTDELSYLKVGIPKGKIFIINPKGEVIVNNILDLKSYTSLHKLVNDMFPPVNLTEREDFNSWNFWKMPLLDVDDL